MTKQFEELTDFQWEAIEDFFPEQAKCKYSLRTILNAILWILRTGSQWRNLDSKYPPWQSVYHHFGKWKRDGRFQQINQHLNEIARYSDDRKSHPSAVCTDSQTVKNAPFINQQPGFDGGKMINGRKRHIITDTMGLVIGVGISAANKHDGTIAIDLFSSYRQYFSRLKKVFADGSYRGNFETVIQQLFEAEVEISSRPPSTRGVVPLKIRWIVERTFAWFNFFRRLSKDYEKTIEPVCRRQKFGGLGIFGQQPNYSIQNQIITKSLGQTYS